MTHSPFMIGVAGGSASGKKNVCNHILSQLALHHPKLKRRIAIISMTDFYRDLTDERIMSNSGQFNHDHPDAMDWKLLDQFLVHVLTGVPTKLPHFDFVQMKRTGWTEFPPTDVIIFHGGLVLYKRKFREKLSIRLFVDVDCDVRLSSVVTRDTLGQNNRPPRSLQHILDQWLLLMKPAFEDFILPTKKYADVIIPRGFENVVALDILIRHIDQILTSKPHSSLTDTCPGQALSAAAVNVAKLNTCSATSDNEDDSSNGGGGGLMSAFASPINASMHRELDYNIQSQFSEIPN